MSGSKKLAEPRVVSAWESSVFVVIQICFAGLVVYWRFHERFSKPSPSPGYAVTALAVGAAAMSVNEHMGRWKKAAWLLILALLAGVEVDAISADRKEQDKHFVRTLSTITGGDSYAYLSLRPLGGTGSRILPVLVQKGTNPLYDVKIKIANLFVDGGPSAVPPTILYLRARDVAVDEKTQLIEYPLPQLGQRMFFAVYFDALNGSWFERVEIRYVGGKWLEAIEVTRTDETSQSNSIYQYSDPEFPLSNGKPDWGTPNI